MISYDPLWRTMKEKKITTYYLTEIKGFSKKSMYNIKKGKNVTLLTLENLCKLLDCGIGDVVEFIPDSGTDTPQSSADAGAKPPHESIAGKQ